MPRSGSTYMCRLATHLLTVNNIDVVKVNPEVSNIDQWKSNEQNIIEENIDLIKQLGLDQNKIDQNFVNRMFLHYLTQPQTVVLKYLPFDSYDFTPEELVAVAKKHDITLIGLYRKNILDTFISQIVKFNFGEITKSDQTIVLSSKLGYDKNILDDLISVYKIYFDIHQLLKAENVLENTIAYEDLTFDVVVDSFVLNYTNSVKSTIEMTEKSVSSSITSYVLSQLPFLKSELQQSLKQHDIPVVDDFYFSLEK